MKTVKGAIEQGLSQMGQWFSGRWMSGLVAVVLVMSIALTGCNSGNVANGVSGNYANDTLALVSTLRTAIDLPDQDPAKKAAQADARAKINAFFSYYRRDTRVEGLPSFRTIRTALNSLAGHYSSYPNRPVPDKLKSRIESEFKQVELALRREA